MARKCDITRRQDILEKVVYGLLLSLLVCTGFHHITPEQAKAAAAILSGPAGCAEGPAFSVGVEAKIASDDDLIPTATKRSTKSTTSTKTSQPNP